jgi:hypothetical protein
MCKVCKSFLLLCVETITFSIDCTFFLLYYKFILVPNKNYKIDAIHCTIDSFCKLVLCSIIGVVKMSMFMAFV